MSSIWGLKKYFLIIFLLALVAGTFWYQNHENFLNPALAQVNNVLRIKGWAWSGNTGWISLDCSNTGASNCDNSNYGLRANITSDANGRKQITGYAWSGNLGWICFGSTCTSGTPPSGSREAYFTCADEKCETNDFELVYGWAKIVSLGDDGWISLRCANTGAVDCTNYGVIINFADGILGSKTVDPNKNWAWHSTISSSVVNPLGVGWIWFNPNPEILAPYLQASGGDVFSKGKFSSLIPPPQDKYNAQYLIQAGGSISSRFTNPDSCTSSGSNQCKKTGYSLGLPTDAPPNLTTDTAHKPYTFKLGKFDFYSLYHIVNASLSTNKYGHKVWVPANLNNLTVFNNALNNSVVYLNNNVTVGSLVLKNGQNINQSGAGTVIVKGDLNITNNITYQESSAPGKQLASVVWIVLGDVNIAPDVSRVDGSFIVLGHSTGVNSCALSTGHLPAGCGSFNTCKLALGGVNCDAQLKVYGSIFAKQFELNRTYINPELRDAAEEILADGRMQLNPPPGFTDFAKGLPTFSRQ